MLEMILEFTSKERQRMLSTVLLVSATIMPDDDYSSAADFFTSIITPEDVVPVDVLLNRISRAPTAAKRYLEKHCRDARELEEFFKENDYLFHVENKRVALFDEQLIKTAEMTVEFFKEKLKQCGRPVDYMQLKMRFLEYAPRNVQHFITRFYPGKDIKRFLKQRPDVFVVHKDHTVFLVEVDSVEFYRRKLKAQKDQRQHFINFRGHIGQADPHVQAYINKNFLGDEFQDFLIRNSDVFRLDNKGFVTLVPPE